MTTLPKSKATPKDQLRLPLGWKRATARWLLLAGLSVGIVAAIALTDWPEAKAIRSAMQTGSRIQTNLFEDPLLKTERDICVTIAGDSITLTGNVHSNGEIQTAERLAREVNGVREVYNDLALLPGPPVPTTTRWLKILLPNAYIPSYCHGREVTAIMGLPTQ
jgi:hypothetical protein